MSKTRWIRGTGAEQRAQRVRNLSPGDHERFAADMVRRAGRLLEMGDIVDAERHLRQGLEKVPNHPECRAYLAICLAAGERKFITASKLTRAILAKNPYDSTAHYAMGRIFLLGGRRAEAFKHFAKARALAEGDRNLQGQLERIDPRRDPVLRFLPRGHVINILFGRIRSLFGRP